MRSRTWTWETVLSEDARRRQSVAVACPLVGCAAKPGHPCRDVHGLTRPAHNKRVKASEAVEVTDA
jgi:hypothetical protein